MADFQARDYRIFETSNLCALIFFPRVLRNSYQIVFLFLWPPGNRVVKCLSRMTRKCHVRFLEEGGEVTLFPYSAGVFYSSGIFRARYHAWRAKSRYTGKSTVYELPSPWYLKSQTVAVISIWKIMTPHHLPRYP